MSTVHTCTAPDCIVPVAASHPYPFCLWHLRKVPLQIRHRLQILAAAAPLLRSAGFLAGPEYLEAIRDALDAIRLAELVEAFDLGGDEEDAQCPFS